MVNFSAQNLPSEVTYNNGMTDTVIEPTAEDKIEVASLLQFSEIPSQDEIDDRAYRITDIVMGYGDKHAAFGDIPPFMIRAIEENFYGTTTMHYPLMENTPKEIERPDGTSATRTTHEFKGFAEGVHIAVPMAESLVEVPKENRGKILSVTRNELLPSQIAAGMVEPSDKDRLLNILSPDANEQTPRDIKIRAVEAAYVAKGEGYDRIAIDKVPPSMVNALGTAMQSVGIRVVYPFVSTSITRDNGEHGGIVKEMQFEGFLKDAPIECNPRYDPGYDGIMNWSETMYAIGELNPYRDIDGYVDKPEDIERMTEGQDDDDDIDCDELTDEQLDSLYEEIETLHEMRDKYPVITEDDFYGGGKDMDSYDDDDYDDFGDDDYDDYDDMLDDDDYGDSVEDWC